MCFAYINASNSRLATLETATENLVRLLLSFGKLYCKQVAIVVSPARLSLAAGERQCRWLILAARRIEREDKIVCTYSLRDSSSVTTFCVMIAINR